MFDIYETKQVIGKRKGSPSLLLPFLLHYISFSPFGAFAQLSLTSLQIHSATVAKEKQVLQAEPQI